MQGFILSLQPVRDEDLWVSVLTSEALLSLYRFYGVRHSVIGLGHKIDFCAKTQGKRGILCLRDVLHLGFCGKKSGAKSSCGKNSCAYCLHIFEMSNISKNFTMPCCAKWRTKCPNKTHIESHAKPTRRFLPLRDGQMH